MPNYPKEKHDYPKDRQPRWRIPGCHKCSQTKNGKMCTSHNRELDNARKMQKKDPYYKPMGWMTQYGYMYYNRSPEEIEALEKFWGKKEVYGIYPERYKY